LFLPLQPQWKTIRLATAAGNANVSQEDTMMRLIVLFMIAGTALLAGCNTVVGAGQDISKGGQAIHNSAEDAK